MGSKYVVITGAGCGKCKIVKKLLTLKGVNFREVDANSIDGNTLINKYSIQSMGVIIDMEAQKIVTLEEVA